jgi:DNA processing protein
VTDLRDLAAIVALLKGSDRPWHQYSTQIEEEGGAVGLLEEAHGLLAEEALERELPEVESWARDGVLPVTVLDAGYPDNLRAVHDRPPLVFIAGMIGPADGRAIAVIGSRDASPDGLRATATLAEHLVAQRFAVVSGLARGVDRAAHIRALECGGRTIAVIGTGLREHYPPEHAALQDRIATEGAVVSQFWPDAPPTSSSFPLRNAVMSGMALATVIIEASHTSGARIQARRALAHGRPVFLRRTLLSQPWARELAGRPGAHVVDSPAEVTDLVQRLTGTESLTA